MTDERNNLVRAAIQIASDYRDGALDHGEMIKAMSALAALPGGGVDGWQAMVERGARALHPGAWLVHDGKSEHFRQGTSQKTVDETLRSARTVLSAALFHAGGYVSPRDWPQPELMNRASSIDSASPRRPSLTEQLQQRCSAWGAYWRAPDAHGVILSQEQALELLRDALGVEVEIQVPAQECPHRFRCDCLGACKHGFSGSGAETPASPTPSPHEADRNG